MLAVSLTACSGSAKRGPALERADAQPLAALADRISHEGPCAQRHDIQLLQQHAVALVNTRRVARALLDPLMSGVNALAEDAPPCIPAVPAVTTTQQEPTLPAPIVTPHGHPKKHEHGHGHGHGDQGD